MEQLQPPTFVAPIAVPVPLRAGELVVLSAPMGPLLAAKAFLVPVLQKLLTEAPDLFDEERIERIKTTRTLEAEDITEACLLLERCDVLVDLVAALAPMPREKVLQLMPDEAAFLFAVIVQVNWDFFVQAAAGLTAAALRLRSLGTNSSPQRSIA
jgi:hypothetical protein